MSSDVETFGNELFTMTATGKFGTAVEYSPDGRFLAVATESGYVSLFDAQTGGLVSTFPG
jgi:WD40 repeat protein